MLKTKESKSMDVCCCCLPLNIGVGIVACIHLILALIALFALEVSTKEIAFKYSFVILELTSCISGLSAAMKQKKSLVNIFRIFYTVKTIIYCLFPITVVVREICIKFDFIEPSRDQSLDVGALTFVSIILAVFIYFIIVINRFYTNLN